MPFLLTVTKSTVIVCTNTAHLQRIAGDDWSVLESRVWYEWQVSSVIPTAYCQEWFHYSDVIMGGMASQITGVSIVNSTVCSGANQRKHQSSASLAFVRGSHRLSVNSPHKGPVTRKMFPFDDVIIQMLTSCLIRLRSSRSRRSSSVLSFRSFRFRDIIFRSFRSKASTLSRWAATSPLSSASGIVWSFCRSHKAA